MKTYHYSVLKNEVIENLNIKEEGLYVDATIGYAGHSSEILKKCKKGFLYAFDEDENAVNFAKDKLFEIGKNFKIFKSNFVNMKNILKENGINEVDGILFDLGFSSPQIDEKSRGFSFMIDAELDMRMDLDNKVSAKDIINNYSEEKLSEIFFKYGEEKLSKVIAKKIVQERKGKAINTTFELNDIIKLAVGANYYYKKHPERKIYQALRIETNHELEVLENVLPDAISILKKGGRMCIITFHSLEDRIVKKIFRDYSEVIDIYKGLPENEIPNEYKAKIKIINKKPIEASKKELEENSRSHSAKLRVIERI